MILFTCKIINLLMLFAHIFTHPYLVPFLISLPGISNSPQTPSYSPTLQVGM